VQLDGATATELEARGANIDHDLWSAKILMDDPVALGGLNEEYLHAGADLVVTATYQASIGGFLKAGLGREKAVELFHLAAEISIRARDRFWAVAENRAGRMKPLVAASLGPYGACLADGSEYRGDYGVDDSELQAFHRERLQLLADSAVDLLAFETVPSLQEAVAILQVLSEFPHLPACLSFSCRDESRVSHGEPFIQAYGLTCEHPQVVAAGMNCLSPALVAPLLDSIDAGRLPVMVYPNSGESWNASAHSWEGQICGEFPVREWYDRGARLFGGCCRTTVQDISHMREQLETLCGAG
jgi:homocysteine S-methyltransferase